MKSIISCLRIAPFLITIAFLFQSCRKFVDVRPGAGMIISEEVFASEPSTISAMAGVYTALRSNNFLMLNGGLSLYGGLASDDILPTNPTGTTLPFYQNDLLATTSAVNSSFYSNSYKVIYHANAVLEGVTNSPSLSERFKKQAIGEMKVVRALLYFYLVNLFGEVPIVTITEYQTNATLARSATEDVYNQIIIDLKDAETLLTPDYPSAGKVRPNKWTAAALLARVFLFKGDWAGAEQKATTVIDGGVYSLLPPADISKVFLKGNKEIIWELASPNELNPPGDGTIFIPSATTTRPAYILTAGLHSSFELGDLRTQNWMKKNTVSGIDYWYPFKYKQRTSSSSSAPSEYAIVVRLAEMHLIRAEARARQSKLTGPNSAQLDLNIIRSRAGLTANSDSDPQAIDSAIGVEYRHELFAEQGHRWLWLKRTNNANAVLGLLKGATWQNTDVLWPIPENELLYNPNLKQNPGY